MRSLLIFAAMNSEARPVQQMLAAQADFSSDSHVSGGLIGANKVSLCVTGIGARRARESARAALDSTSSARISVNPDAVLVIGTCGSLSPLLSENTLVMYSECLSEDPGKPAQRCSSQLNDCFARVLQSNGLACQQISGLTSSRVATRREDRLAFARLGALSIDMESYEIIAVANRLRIPAAVLRVISDSLDRKMPDFDRALKPDGDFDGIKALGIATASPVRTIKMLAASRRAIGHLQKALEVILPVDCF